MKKFILLLIASTIFFNVGYAQSEGEAIEPDFIGETIVLNTDGTTTPLEKSTVQIQSKAGAGLYIVGIGKVKTRITIDGNKAGTRLRLSDGFKIIVKAVDNNSDPMSIINIFKFDTNKKERRAELSSAGTFAGTSQNNLDLVKYSAKKHGESSYLITITAISSGEYGIIVKNPNALDERSIIVATFAINPEDGEGEGEVKSKK